MSRRKTRCIPLMPTSPAPPPTDWHTYCGRIIDEVQARWPESWPESGQNRPIGLCPQCWKRAAVMIATGVTIGLVDEHGRTGRMYPNPQTDLNSSSNLPTNEAAP